MDGDVGVTDDPGVGVVEGLDVCDGGVVGVVAVPDGTDCDGATVAAAGDGVVGGTDGPHAATTAAIEAAAIQRQISREPPLT